MVDYNNTDYISTLSASNSVLIASGVKDGDDHIHSGIIKVLELAAKDTYVIEYGSSLFQQVAGTTRTKFQFSGNISFMREGRFYNATPAAEELKSNPDATNDRYDMLVINNSNALEIREGTAATTPRIVDKLTAGDIPVALIRVVAGTGENVTNREIQLYGYDRGVLATSLAKVYNNAGGEIIDISGTDIRFWGSTAIGAFTLDRTEASKEILTVKNSGGAKAAVIEGTGGVATQPVLDVKYGGASMTSVSGQGKVVIANDVTLTAGSLQVGGNIIKASDGGSTITMDTDDNVTIAGDLTVGGGDIIGPADAALTIKSDTDLIFRIDSDGDGTETFQFKNGADTEIAALDEVGNLQIDGDLTISGGNITSQVTLDAGAIIATGQTFTKLENSRTLDLGSYSPTGVDSYGLTGAASIAGNVNVGEVVKVIQPTLVAALDPGSRIDCLKRVYYFNTNEKNQAAATNSVLAGLATDTNYALIIEGIGADNDNAQGNILGGGGFTVLPNPADHDQKIITLVNLSNTNLFVLSSGIGDDTLIAGFQKGFAAQNITRDIHTIDTYDISRFIRSNRYTSIIASPSLVNIPVGGENSLLLRPLESVTLQAKQVAVENQPLNEIQQFQGWYNTNPWAYWMILNKTTGSGTATWISNVAVAELRLSGAQSGAHIYAERNGGEIHLPASPKMGTQFLIHPIVQTVVKCCNASGGHSNFQGSVGNTAEVIDGGGASDTLAANATSSYIFGPAGKWIKIG